MTPDDDAIIPREYPRHTLDVPLEISIGSAAQSANRGRNVSFGGLAFEVPECLHTGDIVHLRIPTVDPPFEADARVVWCRPENGAYVAGVAFLDAAHAFQSRMVQQVCAIEKYREEAVAAGRPLSTQEAAAEWIARYAEGF